MSVEHKSSSSGAFSCPFQPSGHLGNYDTSERPHTLEHVLSDDICHMRKKTTAYLNPIELRCATQELRLRYTRSSRSDLKKNKQLSIQILPQDDSVINIGAIRAGQYHTRGLTIVETQLDVENPTSREVGSSDSGHTSRSVTTLRQKVDDHINVNSPKYSSKPVSRKDALEEQNDSNSDSEHFDDLQPAGQDEGDSDVEYPGESGGASCADEDVATREKEATQIQDPQSTANLMPQQDHMKGIAILRQLSMHSNLLQCRIALQPAVIACNDRALCQPSSTNSSGGLKRFFDDAFQLVDDIEQLRRDLFATNESITLESPRKRYRNDSSDIQESLSTAFEETQSALRSVTENRNFIEQSTHPFVIETLRKWSNKVNATSTAGLLSLTSSRNAFSSRQTGNSKGALELIDGTMQDNKKIWERTTILRTMKPESHVEGGEVFDDTDFYHQLLREAVEEPGPGISLGSAPQIRQTKVKKKVDTRASKGRKVRYTSHEKLQKFMVPVLHAGWHEEQVDELFATLLGAKARDGGSSFSMEGAILADGFKLFG